MLTRLALLRKRPQNHKGLMNCRRRFKTAVYKAKPAEAGCPIAVFRRLGILARCFERRADFVFPVEFLATISAIAVISRKDAIVTALSNRWLTTAANLASKTWGIAAKLLPEKLEIDDNRSLWVAQAGDYTPTAPLKQTIDVDLAIIGGGFTGVSTAYHFSERYPEKRVALLEAKSLANGASGRNGGMMLNWLALTGDYGDELTARIYNTTHAGIQTIESIIAQHKLDVSYRVDGTVTVYTDAQRAEAAHEEVEYYQSLGIPEEFYDLAALKAKLRMEGVYGAVFDPNSGQINGAQLVRGLRPGAARTRRRHLRGHARAQNPRGQHHHADDARTAKSAPKPS